MRSAIVSRIRNNVTKLQQVERGLVGDYRLVLAHRQPRRCDVTMSLVGIVTQAVDTGIDTEEAARAGVICHIICPKAVLSGLGGSEVPELR